MSNPFATFRKNQKAWMACLVLVAIFAFVIAPFFSYFNDGRNRAAGEQVAVSWKGGSMTVADVQRTSNRHASLVRFLGEVARRVIEQGGKPNVPGFRVDSASGEILDYGIPTNSSPNDVINTRIMNTYGKSLGVSFDDDAVDLFLVNYVNNKLSQKQVEDILRDASNGQLTYFDVRQLLKEDLCLRVVQNLALSGMVTTTQLRSAPLVSPGNTFSNFMKINRSAVVEAFPVFAEDYLEKVAGDPTEDELEAIFSVGSNIVADPRSPEPGFVRSYKANVEFVIGDQQEWIDREKDKLTEEQIRAEYDRRVGLGQLKVPVETPADDSGERPPSPNTTKPGSETAVTEEQPESPEGDTPPADTSENTAAPDPTSETPPAESAAEESAPAEEAQKPEETTSAPETEESTEAPDASEDPKPETDDQSTITKAGSVRLVSFSQEEEPQTESSETGAAEAESTPSPQENTADNTEAADAGGAPQAGSEEASEPEESPASEAAAPVTPADDSEGVAVAAETTDSEPAAAETATSEATAEEPAEPAMRTQTYEEAKDQIVNSLARDAALPALREALQVLMRDHMEPYYTKYRQYQAFQESGLEEQTGEEREKPARPDLKKLAGDLGLKWDESGMIDAYTLGQTPVGQSFMMQGGMPGSQSAVANIVPNLEKFAPLQSIGFDSAAASSGMMPEFLDYLVWKVEDEAAYMPEFDEVRSEVVDAWKQLKARQLAESAAKELAKKVGSGENAWDEALSTTEKTLLVETDPFTWMTMMSDFLNVSAVNKLEEVGNEFMREVFATPTNGVAIAPSANRDIFYIVRVKELAPSDEELQSRFIADPFRRSANMISNSETQGRIGDWFQYLQNDLEVEYSMNVGQF